TLDPMPEVAQQSGLSTAIHTVRIMAKANEAQNLLNRAVKSDMEPNEFLSFLREIGIMANKATDYVDEKTTDLVPSFSKVVLALAPHLGNLSSSSIISDPIFEKSCHLKAAYTSKKSINLLINRAQLKRLMDPISQSVWKKIILDRYVDFEHLYATFEKGYDHIDKSKDFNEEFTIVKKDSLMKKKSILSESDWLCLFDA
ncbi:hypothetical protein H0H87_008768, partial [Tephrocybe sp. NHM501043]